MPYLDIKVMDLMVKPQWVEEITTSIINTLPEVLDTINLAPQYYMLLQKDYGFDFDFEGTKVDYLENIPGIITKEDEFMPFN